MSSNIPTPTPKSRLVQPGSLSSGLRKPASSSALRTPSTTRTASTTKPKPAGGVPSTPRSTSTTARPSLRNASSQSSLNAPAQTPRVKSPSKPTFRSTSSSTSTASTSSNRTATRAPLKSPRKSPAQALPPELPFESKATLSLKDIIAQKRAEAKKAGLLKGKNGKGGGRDSGDGDGEGFLLPEDADSEWNGGRGALGQQEEEDLLGRRSVKDSIERARETGSLNLTSRSLSYIPTNLFSIHLGLDPELLRGQTASTQEESTPHRHLAYYEVVDLTSLKARDNALQHLQPELSLFGSLKVLDFAKNNLSSLPDTLSELACLVHLDLSENAFEAFPENALSYLPALGWLDLSKNRLAALKFIGDGVPPSPGFGSSSFGSSRAGLSQPEVLPALKTLMLSGNKLTAASIDLSGSGSASPAVPRNLVKLDLSGNPLGAASALVDVLAGAQALREVVLSKCDLEAGSFGAGTSGGFASLHVLDVSENGWLAESEVREYFRVVGREVVVGAPSESIDVPPGAVEVRLGLRDTREKWEVEAESTAKSSAVAKKEGELEEQGLAIGERERGAPPPVMGGGRKRVDRPRSVQKERWEVEVDEGLHTEAGRMRKRVEEERKAAEAEEAKAKEVAAKKAAADQAVAGATSTAKGTLDKYYDTSSRTLALPASKKKPAHNRHASLTYSRSAAGTAADPNVPTETLPMTTIASQPWASNLRVLNLRNRRADSVFVLPAVTSGSVRLERVEEVLLEGCALGDLVRVRRSSGEGAVDVGGGGLLEDEAAIFELLGGMFPSMTVLDLAENRLTKVPGLVKLFFPSDGELEDGRKTGLKVLRLQGNSIADVEGLVELAERFGRGESDGWRGEEIDIRNNQIVKLPPVLGLLQLDVLLVEGNAFRVPPRTVWLREGTQGLLRWLRESAVQG